MGESSLDDALPSQEAIEKADAVMAAWEGCININDLDGGAGEILRLLIARALDEFADNAERDERTRCAAIARRAFGEWSEVRAEDAGDQIADEIERDLA